MRTVSSGVTNRLLDGFGVIWLRCYRLYCSEVQGSAESKIFEWFKLALVQKTDRPTFTWDNQPHQRLCIVKWILSFWFLIAVYLPWKLKVESRGKRKMVFTINTTGQQLNRWDLLIKQSKQFQHN